MADHALIDGCWDGAAPAGLTRPTPPCCRHNRRSGPPKFLPILLLVAMAGCALSGSAVLGESGKSAGAPIVLATNAASNSGSPAAVSAGQGQSSKPDNSSKSGKPDDPVQVKKMIDNINASRTKFLIEQKQLQRKLKDATEDQRDQIRQEIRDKRDQFLQEQRDMREEFQRRINELRDQLKEHQDLINSAKEQAKDHIKQRKGGG
jgi:hypothetical protein